jgi:hypothetical protein
MKVSRMGARARNRVLAFQKHGSGATCERRLAVARRLIGGAESGAGRGLRGAAPPTPLTPAVAWLAVWVNMFRGRGSSGGGVARNAQRPTAPARPPVEQATRASPTANLRTCLKYHGWLLPDAWLVRLVKTVYARTPPMPAALDQGLMEGWSRSFEDQGVCMCVCFTVHCAGRGTWDLI